MLPEFKKRIDTLRDILVGAVPSPAGQIEQITYALIYKFMSDIDDRAASLPGGRRTYLAGEYERYGWHELMAPTLGAHDRLTLYREALSSLAKNPGLPTLFQEIYQNAYLTFNDPRVLTLFLKEIDNFKHSNSDDIGDAYEYLLQITGAQGDVGQFRTPRHIIKFIVEAVGPTKSDSVLDPAVGTAGFLIAAYNHVKHHHDGVDDLTGLPNSREERLTSDELDRLHKSYHGFDIDPTMVRTSKVNMYLHGFKTPDIKNHDSLSSEDWWSERYDVILANPPFMSPKGGILPHKKFSINASRAEVLFVDYILDHLKPSGRAGFIVPSSVSINDNASYYKDIRKKVVEYGLTAIIELHDSVFKPYAEVTTHIYIIDRHRKKMPQIPYIRLKNDGFDKSDTRKPIHGSELMNVLDFLKDNNNNNNNNNGLDISYIDVDEFWNSENYYLSPHLNSRAILGIEGGVELSTLIEECKERVRDESVEVLSVSNKVGFVIAEEYFNKRVASANISNYKIIRDGFFAYNPSRINVGSIAYNSTFNLGAVSPMYQVFKVKNTDIVDPRYLILILKSMAFLQIIEANIKGSTRKVIKLDRLKKISIPLPAIDNQRQIVAEIEKHEEYIEKKIQEIQNEKIIIKSKITQVWDK